MRFVLSGARASPRTCFADGWVSVRLAVDVLGGLPDHGDDSGSLSRAAPPCFPGSRDLPSFANLQGCVMLPLSRVLLPRPCKPPAYLIVWPWFTSVCPTSFTDIGERERQGNDGLFVTRGYHLAGRSWTQLDVPVPTWKASTGCKGTGSSAAEQIFSTRQSSRMRNGMA